MDTGNDGTARCGDRCMRMTSAGLCDRCVSRLRRDLIELEQIYVSLPTERTRTLSGKVSGTREAPAPVDLARLSWLGPTNPAETLCREWLIDQDGQWPLAATLGTWARRVAEERDLYGAITNPFLFLLRHLDWTVQQEWSDDYAEEIHQQLRAGRGLSGTNRVTHRLKTPCPSCGVAALCRGEGSEWVDCQSCQGGWDAQRWPREQAS